MRIEKTTNSPRGWGVTLIGFNSADWGKTLAKFDLPKAYKKQWLKPDGTFDDTKAFDNLAQKIITIITDTMNTVLQDVPFKWLLPETQKWLQYSVYLAIEHTILNNNLIERVNGSTLSTPNFTKSIDTTNWLLTSDVFGQFFKAAFQNSKITEYQILGDSICGRVQYCDKNDSIVIKVWDNTILGTQLAIAPSLIDAINAIPSTANPQKYDYVIVKDLVAKIEETWRIEEVTSPLTKDNFTRIDTIMIKGRKYLILDGVVVAEGGSSNGGGTGAGFTFVNNFNDIDTTIIERTYFVKDLDGKITDNHYTFKPGESGMVFIDQNGLLHLEQLPDNLWTFINTNKINIDKNIQKDIDLQNQINAIKDHQVKTVVYDLPYTKLNDGVLSGSTGHTNNVMTYVDDIDVDSLPALEDTGIVWFTAPNTNVEKATRINQWSALSWDQVRAHFKMNDHSFFVTYNAAPFIQNVNTDGTYKGQTALSGVPGLYSAAGKIRDGYGIIVTSAGVWTFEWNNDGDLANLTKLSDPAIDGKTFDGGAVWPIDNTHCVITTQRNKEVWMLTINQTSNTITSYTQVSALDAYRPQNSTSIMLNANKLLVLTTNGGIICDFDGTNITNGYMASNLTGDWANGGTLLQLDTDHFMVSNKFGVRIFKFDGTNIVDFNILNLDQEVTLEHFMPMIKVGTNKVWLGSKAGLWELRFNPDWTLKYDFRIKEVPANADFQYRAMWDNTIDSKDQVIAFMRTENDKDDMWLIDDKENTQLQSLMYGWRNGDNVVRYLKSPTTGKDAFVSFFTKFELQASGKVRRTLSATAVGVDNFFELADGLNKPFKMINDSAAFNPTKYYTKDAIAPLIFEKIGDREKAFSQIANNQNDISIINNALGIYVNGQTFYKDPKNDKDNGNREITSINGWTYEFLDIGAGDKSKGSIVVRDELGNNLFSIETSNKDGTDKAVLRWSENGKPGHINLSEIGKGGTPTSPERLLDPTSTLVSAIIRKYGDGGVSVTEAAPGVPMLSIFKDVNNFLHITPPSTTDPNGLMIVRLNGTQYSGTLTDIVNRMKWVNRDSDFDPVIKGNNITFVSDMTGVSTGAYKFANNENGMYFKFSDPIKGEENILLPDIGSLSTWVVAQIESLTSGVADDVELLNQYTGIAESTQPSPEKEILFASVVADNSGRAFQSEWTWASNQIVLSEEPDPNAQLFKLTVTKVDATQTLETTFSIKGSEIGKPVQINYAGDENATATLTQVDPIHFTLIIKKSIPDSFVTTTTLTSFSETATKSLNKRVETNKNDISNNKTDIGTNKTDIATNTNAILANKTEIANLEKKGIFRGTYATLDAAKAAISKPVKGDYILIGTASPFLEYIYDTDWEQAGTSTNVILPSDDQLFDKTGGTSTTYTKAEAIADHKRLGKITDTRILDTATGTNKITKSQIINDSNRLKLITDTRIFDNATQKNKVINDSKKTWKDITSSYSTRTFTGDELVRITYESGQRMVRIQLNKNYDSFGGVGHMTFWNSPTEMWNLKAMYSKNGNGTNPTKIMEHTDVFKDRQSIIEPAIAQIKPIEKFEVWE